MDTNIYKLDDLPKDSTLGERLIFDKLLTEFGKTYQIFREVQEFGRWISAGVGTTQTAAIIHLRKGIRERDTQLSQSEIERIRGHLASGVKANFTLEIPTN